MSKHTSTLASSQVAEPPAHCAGVSCQSGLGGSLYGRFPLSSGGNGTGHRDPVRSPVELLLSLLSSLKRQHQSGINSDATDLVGLIV